MEDEVKGRLRRSGELTDFGSSIVGAASSVDEKKDSVVEESENTRGLTMGNKAGIFAEGGVAAIM